MTKHGQLIDSSTRKFFFSFLRKKFLYTLIYRRRKASSDITVSASLSILLLVAANITACTLWLTDRAELSRRCSTLFMINVIPLYLGGRTNFLVDRVLRLPLDQSTFLHRWMGRICVLQGLVHGVINATTSSSSVTETLLLSLIAAIGALSFLYIRRYMYEMFIKAHLMFALASAGTLWLHIPLARTRTSVCLIIASVLWILQHTLWLVRIIYRNSRSGSSRNLKLDFFRSEHGTSQAVELVIDLEKPWEVGPGQYIYLTLPRVARHHAGFIQAHPYIIAWVDGSEIAIIIQRYSGFSDALFTSPDPRSSVIVDGPYGHPQDLNKYDKVLLMASGIGITAHLLTIKHLLEAHGNQTARVRRLTLVWFLESSDQEQWAIKYLKRLYDIDDRRIFTLMFFVPPEADALKSGSIEQVAERWRRTDQPLDVAWYIDEESSAEAGNMAISVCGPPDFEDAVRRGVRSSSNDIYLLNAGFRPEETMVSRTSSIRYS